MYWVYQAEFQYNDFTGPIPRFTELSSLDAIAMSDNYLTGTLAADISQLTVLGRMHVESNYITGTIPEDWSDLQYVANYFLSDNLLTGTLPAYFGQRSSIAFLYVDQNMLTGTLPSLANATNLVVFKASTNRLVGSLSDVFDAAGQAFLTTVVVGDNQFTGSLPEGLFTSESLQVFVAHSNCFHGSIPAALCRATGLSALVLDGLSSAKQCRDQYLTGSYRISGKIYGSIPACLFQLPNVTSLHLSGNGLTGSLPDNVDITQTLYDITVSHNVLTGAIPRQIQERPWLTLDLSYNRFSGTLRSDFGTQSYNFSHIVAQILKEEDWLKYWQNLTGLFVDVNRSRLTIDLAPTVLLVNNRLSGRIPGALHAIHDVSVLGTNLFTCKIDGSDLPPYDSGLANFQCGSSAFDVPYYLWLSVCTMVGVCAYVMSRREQAAAAVERTQLWFARSRGDAATPGLAAFTDWTDFASTAAVAIFGWIILALIPVCLTLSTEYGNFTYEYAWSLSAAFLSGTVPFAVEFIVWTTTLSLLCAGTALYQRRTATHGGTNPLPALPEVLSVVENELLVFTLYATMDVAVVVSVNIAYVYIAVYKSSGLLTMMQVFMSFFKVLWTHVCTSRALRQSCFSQADYLSLQIFVALLNNIVIPCCVVAVVSPNCFYDALVPAPAVHSSYVTPECKVFGYNLDCMLYFPQRYGTFFEPPFIYSYQCSSSMITYYAPTFVNMCLISSFVSPTAQLSLLWVYNASPRGGIARRVLEVVLPPLLRLPTLSAESSSPAAPRRSFYNVNTLVTSMVSFLGILMTYGVVFPPLAAAVTATVLCVSVAERVKVGRFVDAYSALPLTAAQ
jgi:hypothetical protein